MNHETSPLSMDIGQSARQYHAVVATETMNDIPVVYVKIGHGRSAKKAAEDIATTFRDENFMAVKAMNITPGKPFDEVISRKRIGEATGMYKGSLTKRDIAKS